MKSEIKKICDCGRGRIQAIRTLLVALSFVAAPLSAEVSEIVPLDDDCSITIPEGTTSTIDPSGITTNWQKKVGLWLDASKENSIGFYPDNANPAKKDNFPLVKSWRDCRGDDTSGIYLYNGNNNEITLPYLANENGPGGKNYVSMGRYSGVSSASEKRRLVMVSGEKAGQTSPRESISAAYAILVFGSQNGGGRAVLGSSDSSLRRVAEIDKPFFESSGFQMFTNGVETTGNVACPNENWQILSMDFNGTKEINALGRFNDANNSGGQNYAEVILFSEKPTENERRFCETYLARKWGLANDYVSTSRALPILNLHGKGAVAITADSEIRGGFQGTITVPPNVTLALSHNAPPNESAVPSENRLVWFDPDLAEAVKMTGATADENDKRINFLYPRSSTGAIDTTQAMRGSIGAFDKTDELKDDRCPWTNCVARGWGEVRTWLEFSNIVNGDAVGNTLRYQNPIDPSQSTSHSLGPVREGFMVLDTSKGGGTPIGTAIEMTNTKRSDDGKTAQAPIWPSESVSPVTRLDDVPVDSGGGFNARPEVLSFTFDSAWNPKFFGAPYKSEGSRTELEEGGAEILGESIFFSAPLSGEDRTKVTAYLAYKWFGKVLHGYSELSKMTVAGEGNVEMRANTPPPKFGDGFTGALHFTGGGFTFTLDTRSPVAVKESLALPCDVRLPENCVIGVDCVDVGEPKGGIYPLITAKSIAGSENCTLEFNCVHEGVRARLVEENSSLRLFVAGRGAIIIIR